jgi:hypothetical protein
MSERDTTDDLLLRLERIMGGPGAFEGALLPLSDAIEAALRSAVQQERARLRAAIDARPIRYDTDGTRVLNYGDLVRLLRDDANAVQS